MSFNLVRCCHSREMTLIIYHIAASKAWLDTFWFSHLSARLNKLQRPYLTAESTGLMWRLWRSQKWVNSALKIQLGIQDSNLKKCINFNPLILLRMNYHMKRIQNHVKSCMPRHINNIHNNWKLSLYLGIQQRLRKIWHIQPILYMWANKIVFKQKVCLYVFKCECICALARVYVHPYIHEPMDARQVCQVLWLWS